MKRWFLFISLIISVPAIAQISVEHTVYFDLDRHEFKDSELSSLENFFENLIYLPILEVEILGYCDDRGSVEYNQELSEKRVETVAEWLIDHNVNMKNIDKQISGKGEVALPDVNNKLEVLKTRAQNRRVDLRFLLKEEFSKKLTIPVLLRDQLTADQLLVINDYEKTFLRESVNFTVDSTIENQLDTQDYIEVPTQIVPPLDDQDDLLKSLRRSNFKMGEIIILKKVHFLRGRSTLNPESIPLIKRIIEILVARPNVKFEIRGHVCCINPIFEDALDRNTMQSNLSYARARLIHTIFKEYKIDESRMTFAGYGRKKPLGGTDRDDRRVELYITGI